MEGSAKECHQALPRAAVPTDHARSRKPSQAGARSSRSPGRRCGPAPGTHPIAREAAGSSSWSARSSWPPRRCWRERAQAPDRTTHRPCHSSPVPAPASSSATVASGRVVTHLGQGNCALPRHEAHDNRLGARRDRLCDAAGTPRAGDRDALRRYPAREPVAGRRRRSVVLDPAVLAGRLRRRVAPRARPRGRRAGRRSAPGHGRRVRRRVRVPHGTARAGLEGRPVGWTARCSRRSPSTRIYCSSDRSRLPPSPALLVAQ